MRAKLQTLCLLLTAALLGSLLAFQRVEAGAVIPANIQAHAVHVYKTADQASIPSATWTMLTWDAELRDPRGLCTPGGTNTTIATIAKAGEYRLSYVGQSSGHEVRPYVNDVAVPNSCYYLVGAGYSFEWQLALVAGDTVKLGVYRTGGTWTLTAAGTGYDPETSGVTTHRVEATLAWLGGS